MESMTREEIAARLARGARISTAEAADELDRLVHRILVQLRQGKPVTLPGLGKLKLGRDIAGRRSRR
jgi:nucleoid DNA-binding protein